MPLAQADVAAYPSALPLMRSIADQVQNTDDYARAARRRTRSPRVRLRRRADVPAGEGRTALDFDGCEFTDGVPLTGTGRSRDSGAVTMDLTLPDGELRYRMRPSGKDSVTGSFRGRKVDQGAG